MAEKRVIELEVKTDSVKSLKAQLREAQADVQQLSEKFGATSKEAINAAKRAAELKDAIGDAKALTDAYNPDAKFNALSASIGGVLNGFQAFQGALGLVGVQGEEVEKALLKVQSAMALTQGINGILEAKEDFGRLGKQITDVYSKAVAGFQNMTTAGKAFAVTGIGLLITGLTLVITYWDDIKRAVGGVSEEEKKLAEFRRKHEAERRDFVAQESAGFAMALSQLKATNEGSKERSKLISEINQKYGTTLKNLSDEKAFQQQINDELKNYLAYQTAKFKLQANEEAIVNNLKTQSRLRQEILQAEKDREKALDEGALRKKMTYETDEMGRRIALGVEEVNVNSEAYKRYVKNNEIISKNNKELANAEKRFENYGKAALKAGAEISKLTDNGKKYVEQNKEIVQTTEKVTKEVTKNAEDKSQFDLEQIELDEKRQEQAYQRKLDAAAKAAEEEKAQEDKYRAEKLAAEEADEKRQEQAWQREQEGNQKLQDLKYDAVYAGLNLISDLASVFGKKGEKEAKRAFQIQKAASIAAATVQTYQSATSAYASQFVPIPDPTSPVRGAIAAGIAVAAGLGNIAKIASQKFEGGGGGGGGSAPAPSAGGGGGGTMAPNFNIVGNAQAQNPLANLGQQPIKAYVVSGEVTTAQSLDRQKVYSATFG